MQCRFYYKTFKTLLNLYLLKNNDKKNYSREKLQKIFSKNPEKNILKKIFGGKVLPTVNRGLR